MYFSQILVLGAALAVANANVMITNSDYSGITFDSPFTVTWQGATGMVSLLLKNGVPSNQLLVDTIAGKFPFLALHGHRVQPHELKESKLWK